MQTVKRLNLHGHRLPWLGWCLILALAAAGSGGCQVDVSKPISPTESQQKLTRILKDEYGLEPVTKQFGQTLWIYLPVQESFLSLKANPEPAAPPSAEATMSQTIHFLDGSFNGKDFVVRYDIGPVKSYAKDPGYKPAFSETYKEIQQNIFKAVFRAYADFEDDPDGSVLVRRVEGDIDFIGREKNETHKRMVHDYVKTEKAPVLIALVAADITNGLEARVYVHLKDLRRAFMDQTFQEEYIRRVISDQPAGSTVIIGDAAGNHVDFHDISLPEFISKQIVYRVTFKYTQSAFPPTGTPREEILRAAADAVGSYDFKDFGAVVLKDLHEGSTARVSPGELPPYAAPTSQGRIIHIKFK